MSDSLSFPLPGAFPRSFGLAVCLHAGLLLLVVLFFRDERISVILPSSSTFTLVNTSGATDSDGVQRETLSATVQVAVPQLRPASLESVATEPDAMARPAAKPTHPASPAVAPQPRTTIKEFQAAHPGARPSGPKPSVRPGPRISESYTKELMANSTAATTAAAGPAPLTFVSALLRDLKKAFELGGGVDEGLRVEVSFRLARDGTLTDVAIVRSSGSAEFDARARAAFARVRARGFEAGDVGVRYSVTFRAVGE